MKKALLLFGALLFFCSVSWGTDCKSSSKMYDNDNCGCKNECENKYKKNCEKNSPCDKTSCKSCSEEIDIDDDEYCTYNQCYFDRQYRKLKKSLCLTRRQETCLDNLYCDFKADMERQCEKYRICKNELLEMIECDTGCAKDRKNVLKEMKKETREKLKDFDEDVREILCKNQKSDYRKFKKYERKKMRQITKYAPVYKFPCVKCCD